MNDIKDVLPVYLCSNSDGINECVFGRMSIEIWVFLAQSREDERGAVRGHENVTF